MTDLGITMATVAGLTVWAVLALPVIVYLTVKLAVIGYWSGWIHAVRDGNTPYYVKNESERS